MVGYTKEARDAAHKKFIENSVIRKNIKLSEYELNPKKCGNVLCENTLTFQNKKNTFCSRSCSNSVVKRLNSDSISKMKDTWANKPNSVLLKQKTCKECGDAYKSETRKRFCSEECKTIAKSKSGRKSAFTAIANGNHNGWPSRKDKAPSYPEQYFISVFENENIKDWQREFKFQKWFIDFAFIEKKIAVEIDGKQHEARKDKDAEKDAALILDGWEVIRIPWYNPRTERGKELLHPLVKNLLSILQEAPLRN